MAFAVRTKPFRSPAMSRTTPRQRIVNRSRDILAVGPFYSPSFFFPFFSISIRGASAISNESRRNSSYRYKDSCPRDINRTDV